MTNVAVVRYKRNGKKFEIAAYRNMVLNYRAGVEKDLDEVLQVTSVFENVSRGIHANASELEKAFGTSDPAQVCKIILSQGELQVGDKERQAEYSSKFRDVATLVAGRCVNTQTGWPFPVSTIETAMRDTIHYAVNPNRPSKQQAKEVEERLKAHLPLARARMHLKLSAPVSSFVDRGVSSSDATESTETNVEAKGGQGGRKTPLEQDLEALLRGGEKGKIVNVSQKEEGSGCESRCEVEVVVDPHLFRELEALVKRYEDGGLNILSFSLQAASEADLQDVVLVGTGGTRDENDRNDFDEDNNEHNDGNESEEEEGGGSRKPGKKKKQGKGKSRDVARKPVAGRRGEEDVKSFSGSTAGATTAATKDGKSDASAAVVVVASDSPSGSTEVASSSAGLGGLKCSTCNVSFGDDRVKQRAHYKTDFHTYNVKLKGYELPTVTEREFTNMSEEDRRAVLFDWKVGE